MPMTTCPRFRGFHRAVVNPAADTIGWSCAVLRGTSV